jgi:general secretion pathway protein J
VNQPRSAEHGFTSLNRSAQHGFTLIELMISLFIFGMIAAAGVGLLNFSVRAQAATEKRLTELAGERRISSLLSADLAQIVPRLTRDTSGAITPAFDGGKGEVLLSYVRAGVANSGNAARSGLQRVEWRLVQGRLERVTRPMLDGASDAPPVIMARSVSAATVRFRVKGEWRDDWSATDPLALPRAIEISITQGGRKAIVRKFLAGTGY